MTSNPTPTIAALLEHCEQEPKALLDWLTMQPEYEHHYQRANDLSQKLKPPESLLKRFLKSVQHFFWADASDLYGRAHVDKKLLKDANNTATIISVANSINVITTIPFIMRCFGGMGVLTIVLSGVTSWCVLHFSNQLGIAVVVKTARERPGKQIAHIGFALLNLLLSLTALPGTPLLLDRPVLAERKAQEMIDREVQQQQVLQLDNSKQEARCSETLKGLDALAKDDPRRDGLYVRAWGTWAERGRDWSKVPTEQLPICHQWNRLNQEADTRKKEFESFQNNFKAKVAQNGPALFLKKERPEIYLANFDTEGLLRSGSEESRIAFEQIGSAIVKGQWASLGFAGFLFALSMVTSGVAVFIVSSYAQRQDVALSFDAYLYDIREDMFQAIARGLGSATISSSALVPSQAPRIPTTLAWSRNDSPSLRFLALCAEQIRQSGECRYPVLLDFIQSYTTSGGHHWKSKPHIRLRYYYERIQTLCQRIMTMANRLQQADRMNNLAQSSSLIRMVGIAAKALELELQGVQSFLNKFQDVTPLVRVNLIANLSSSLQTVTFTRKYLQSHEASQGFSSHPDTTKRVYRYLSELQEAAHEITQTFLVQIYETGLALKIYP